MLPGKICSQESVMNRSGKGNINNPVRVQMSDLGPSEAEFAAAKAVRVSGNVRPGGDFVFQLFQIIHPLELPWLLFR